MRTRLQVLVLSIIAGALVLGGLFGSWSGGVGIAMEDEYSASGFEPFYEIEMGLSISEIIDLREEYISLFNSGEFLGDTSAPGVQFDFFSSGFYYLLYLLLPCAILFFILGVLLCLPPSPSMPTGRAKRVAMPAVVGIGILTMGLGVYGIALVLMDDLTMIADDRYLGAFDVELYFKPGYGGFLVLIGGLVGLIGAVRSRVLLWSDHMGTAPVFTRVRSEFEPSEHCPACHVDMVYSNRFGEWYCRRCRRYWAKKKPQNIGDEETIEVF